MRIIDTAMKKIFSTIIKYLIIQTTILISYYAILVSLRGARPQSKEELRYLLKNDLKRSRLARTIF